MSLKECFARRQVDGLRLQSFLEKLPKALAFPGLHTKKNAPETF